MVRTAPGQRATSKFYKQNSSFMFTQMKHVSGSKTMPFSANETGRKAGLLPNATAVQRGASLRHGPVVHIHFIRFRFEWDADGGLAVRRHPQWKSVG